MTERRCIFAGCVATWEHWHGGFPGGYDNPDDPTGPPIPFTGPAPEAGVRDYNGALLATPTTEAGRTLLEALLALDRLSPEAQAAPVSWAKAIAAIEAQAAAQVIRSEEHLLIAIETEVQKERERIRAAVEGLLPDWCDTHEVPTVHRAEVLAIIDRREP